MASQNLEDRLAAVENELIQIKRLLSMSNTQADIAPWEKMFGSFVDSEGFDDAVRLGREYREAQRPEREGGDVQ